MKKIFEFLLFKFVDFLIFIYINCLRLFYRFILYLKNKMIDIRRFSPWYKRYETILYKYNKKAELYRAIKKDLTYSYQIGELQWLINEEKKIKKKQFFEFLNALKKIIFSIICFTISTVLLINNDTTFIYTFFMDFTIDYPKSPTGYDHWWDYDTWNIGDLYNTPDKFEIPQTYGIVDSSEYYDPDSPYGWEWTYEFLWVLYHLYFTLIEPNLAFNVFDFIQNDSNFVELRPTIEGEFNENSDFDKFFKDTCTLEELNDFLEKDLEYVYEGYCIEKDLEIAEKNANLMEEEVTLNDIIKKGKKK